MMRIAAVALLGVLAGCGRQADGSAGGMRGGAASVDDLGRAVVAALAAGDTAALQAMRTTEHEHNVLLWPHFPAARQNPPAPADFAWENIQLRNASATHEWIASFRNRKVRFEEAKCAGDVEQYGPFQILRDCAVRVTDVAQGRAFDLRPFDRVVRMNGVHKVIRYVEID